MNDVLSMECRDKLPNSGCKARLGHHATAGDAMQQIGDWLKKLGMSEYAKRFAENVLISVFSPT
jgi:SAM domain (Sterile alpha motif)